MEPAVDSLEAIAWAPSNRELVNRWLLEHGAVLFRGFGIKSAAEFESFARGICGELYGEYGDLPREQQGQNIYQSTVYPQEETIHFHNESSHLDCWPMKIIFFCAVAAEQGGETPLLDCHLAYQRMDPVLRRQFEKKGLAYVRTFVTGLDVPWQEFFRTEREADVETYCREHGFEFEWLGQRGLRVRKQCPAVLAHPKTGKLLFFNQIQLHHPACLDADVRQSLQTIFAEDKLPRNVFFGDGSRIDDDIVGQLGDLYSRTAVTLPWETGDVMLLDNMRVAHSRNPFQGPRKVLVAMSELHTNR